MSFESTISEVARDVSRRRMQSQVVCAIMEIAGFVLVYLGAGAKTMVGAFLIVWALNWQRKLAP